MSPKLVDLPLCIGHAVHVHRAVNELLGELIDLHARPSSTRPEPHAWVYYLMLGPATVKIGTTIDLRQRLAQLRTDAQYVVAIERGGLDIERKRLIQFADERIGKRENFRLSERLKEHIEALQPDRDELVEIALRGRRAS
jgi:hypothetical protein